MNYNELLITDIFGCRDKMEVRNDVILNNDVINYLLKLKNSYLMV